MGKQCRDKQQHLSKWQQAETQLHKVTYLILCSSAELPMRTTKHDDYFIGGMTVAVFKSKNDDMGYLINSGTYTGSTKHLILYI